MCVCVCVCVFVFVFVADNHDATGQNCQIVVRKHDKLPDVDHEPNAHGGDQDKGHDAHAGRNGTHTLGRVQRHQYQPAKARVDAVSLDQDQRKAGEGHHDKR